LKGGIQTALKGEELKMEKQSLELRKSDRVEITTLVDNYTDVFLPDSEHVKRNPLITEGNITRGLLADHGFSLLLEVFEGDEHHQFLLDAGWVEVAVPFNLETLGISLRNVEAVILGHGHLDHFGGLFKLYKDGLVPTTAPLLVHPDAFLQRSVAFPDGRSARMPQLLRRPFQHLGVPIQESRNPLSIGYGLGLLTGEIERVTDFEIGFPPGRKFENGELKPDTQVLDEQAVLFNVKGKGLVVVTSCSHPGIINTLLYAQKLTGEKKIYAVIGGFHLTGPWQSLVERTVEEMKKFSPEIVVPTHCTGWKGVNRFAQEMPGQFVLNSVGTKIIL
jgi:7,8-dihydropterin-6-yl-methyl-4-(beta-D-ribofuranosyl)aminobenzene 5'-phosphate synthase